MQSSCQQDSLLLTVAFHPWRAQRTEPVTPRVPLTAIHLWISKQWLTVCMELNLYHGQRSTDSNRNTSTSLCRTVNLTSFPKILLCRAFKIISYDLGITTFTSDLGRFKSKTKTPTWHGYFWTRDLHVLAVLSIGVLQMEVYVLQDCRQNKISRVLSEMTC